MACTVSLRKSFAKAKKKQILLRRLNLQVKANAVPQCRASRVPSPGSNKTLLPCQRASNTTRASEIHIERARKPLKEFDKETVDLFEDAFDFCASSLREDEGSYLPLGLSPSPFPSLSSSFLSKKKPSPRASAASPTTPGSGTPSGGRAGR